MSKDKKEKTPISLRIETVLLEKLNEFCDNSGQSKTVAIERALSKYIDDYWEEQKLLEKTKNPDKT